MLLNALPNRTCVTSAPTPLWAHRQVLILFMRQNDITGRVWSIDECLERTFFTYTISPELAGKDIISLSMRSLGPLFEYAIRTQCSSP